LSAEAVDWLYRLGVGDRVVGVSGYSLSPPEARQKPKVSAFTTIHYDVIESLQPDLIIGFSDLQAEATRELGKRGYSVFLTNQRTLQETFGTLVMMGRLVGKGPEAEALVTELESQVEAARRASQAYPRRPKVYFEEWDDPLITGITWVSELIEAAGGMDAFPELRGRPTATERVVQPNAVIERAPDIIIASWCGRKADLNAICARAGWEAIPAVKTHQVYEIKSAYCLQPGAMLVTEGLKRFCTIVENWQHAWQVS